MVLVSTEPGHTFVRIVAVPTDAFPDRTMPTTMYTTNIVGRMLYGNAGMGQSEPTSEQVRTDTEAATMNIFVGVSTPNRFNISAAEIETAMYV